SASIAWPSGSLLSISISIRSIELPPLPPVKLPRRAVAPGRGSSQLPVARCQWETGVAGDWERATSSLDLHPDTAGRAGDDPAGVLQVAGVEVGNLGLGDLLDLVGGDRPDLGLVGLGGAGGDAGGLLQEDGGRGTLGH